SSRSLAKRDCHPDAPPSGWRDGASPRRAPAAAFAPATRRRGRTASRCALCVLLERRCVPGLRYAKLRNASPVRRSRGASMRVPLTVNDFLERASLVYGERVGLVDEPEQPVPSLDELTYRRVQELARAQAAALDHFGIGFGERVAIVSPNAARLFISFFGVSGSGRILVPVNFRLNADEVGYIVEHSGASMLLVDPELDDSLSSVGVKHRFVMGTQADAGLFLAR